MPRQRSAPAPARSSAAAAPRPRPAASTPPPAASSSTPASSGSWFGSRPAAPQASAPAPAPFSSAPPPAMQSSGGGGMMAGLMGSVVQGAALGTGSAIAHRAVDSFMGPRETKVVHEHQGAAPAPAAAPMAPQGTSNGPCGERVHQFTECMSRYNGDMGACQPYFDAMQQCKLQYGA